MGFAANAGPGGVFDGNGGRLTLGSGGGSLRAAMSTTLFERIIAREIPATIVYEDQSLVAFRDIKPQAPVHILLVTKKPIPRIGDAGPEDQSVLGLLLLKAAEVARGAGLERSGYRLVLNN